jgi:hypothetical protein
MKITIVEGTPAEIRATFPDLIGASTGVVVAGVDGGVTPPADSDALQAWLDSRANTTHSKAVERLVYTLIAEGLKAEIGVASKAEDGKAEYVRMHIPATKDLPAIAYIFPRQARVNVRLPEEVAQTEKAHVVQVRHVKKEDRHKIQVQITDNDSVETARRLIEEARKATLEEYGD